MVSGSSGWKVLGNPVSEGGSFAADGISAAIVWFLVNGGGRRLVLQRPGWALGNRRRLLKSP